MAGVDEAFDPYRKWLGIPPAEQPPHHYRLLGIALFESDPDVIANAADARMAHVKTFQTGRHADLSQRVLNHLASAKVCLLRPESKAEYDRSLRAELDARRPAAASPLPRAVPVPPPAEAAVAAKPDGPPAIRAKAAEGLPRLKPTYVKRRRKQPWRIVAALVLLIGVLGAALVILLTRPPQWPPWRSRPIPPPTRSPEPGAAAPEPPARPANSVAPDRTPEKGKRDASAEDAIPD